MTNDEFCKLSFRAFQTVEDEFLEIHDGSVYKGMYQDSVFPARIEHCFTDRQKAFKIIRNEKKILPQ